MSEQPIISFNTNMFYIKGQRVLNVLHPAHIHEIDIVDTTSVLKIELESALLLFGQSAMHTPDVKSVRRVVFCKRKQHRLRNMLVVSVG